MILQTNRWYFHIMQFGKHAAQIGAVSQIRLYDKQNNRVVYQKTIRYQKGMIE